MSSTRSTPVTPVTLESLLESQRQMWKHKCPTCGAEPRARATELALRARIRELEWKIQDLEERLSASLS